MVPVPPYCVADRETTAPWLMGVLGRAKPCEEVTLTPLGGSITVRVASETCEPPPEMLTSTEMSPALRLPSESPTGAMVRVLEVPPPPVVMVTDAPLALLPPLARGVLP